MRVSSPVRVCGASSALLAILGAQVAALADDKPAGELWQQTVSMEMTGMSMPPRTLQVCVPPGKAEEALSKPHGPGMADNCTLVDAKREGNRFTARFMCTGKQPVEGTVENIFDGDHVKGTMTLSMNGQQMTMKTDSQKVGTACTPKVMPGAK